MRRIVAAVVLGIAIAVAIPLADHKTLANSGSPQPVGNGNCTYANGMVQACPSSMVYTGSMIEPVPAAPVEPQSDPVADPVTPPTPPVTDGADTPVVDPATVPAPVATPAPELITQSKDGPLTAGLAP